MNEMDRVAKAVELKMDGRHNCAQAVACAYADVAGLSHEMMADVTAAFGAGMGNMEGTCGALVGAGVIVGMVKKDRMEARKVMKSIMDDFAARNGAVQCRMLKGIGTGKVLRQCNDCVADAAAMLRDRLAGK